MRYKLENLTRFEIFS